MKGGDFKQMILNKAMSFGQQAGKKYLCEGDISSLKQRAAQTMEAMNADMIKKYLIQAIQMMPAETLSNILKASPICAPGGSMPMSMSMFGGKKQKTRKQKRKQRKTRKH
jgi:ketopantoate hydroxymethyltransferase